MAKNTFLDWDTTAAQNTDVGGIGILGTNNVSNFDNALRTIMAQLKAGVDGEVVFASKSANYTAVVNDNNAVHRFTANATLSLTAAATLGSGWHYTVFANGGTVTVDPNGSETINGATTLTVADGSVAAIFCDGTGFRAYNLPTLSGNNTWSGQNTIAASDPRLKFIDTDTNVDHAIAAQSAAGGLFIYIDQNSEGSDPSFAVQIQNATKMTLGTTSCSFTQPMTINTTGTPNSLTLVTTGGGGGDAWGGRLLTLQNFAPSIVFADQSASAGAGLQTYDGGQMIWRHSALGDGSDLVERYRINMTNGDQIVTSVFDTASRAPNLFLDRASPSPANGDELASIRFRGRDSGGNATDYAQIFGYAPDVTDGSEDGGLRFATLLNGVSANRMTLSPEGNLSISGALYPTDQAGTRANLGVAYTLISTTDASNQATVDIALPAGYDGYQLHILGLDVATGGADLRCRFSTDNGSTYISSAGAYRDSVAFLDTGPAWTMSVNGTVTDIEVARNIADTNPITVHSEIDPGATGRNANVQFRSVFQSVNPGQRHSLQGGMLFATGRITNIRFFASSGNILSGRFKLIGY